MDICYNLAKPHPLPYGNGILTVRELSTDSIQKTELELVKKAQSDLQCFAVLYEKYVEKVYRFFHFRLQDDNAAKDLTSETFEKVVTKLHTFQDHGYPFSTWLFRIARNVLIDNFRAKDRHKTTSLDDLLPADQPTTHLDPDLIDNHQAIEKIKEIIKTLPQLQQDIWGLKLGSDLSHKQIAHTLGISENYVNVSLFRSIQVIKDRFVRS